MKHLHVGPTCPCKEKHPMIMISMKHLSKHRWWTSDCDFATVVFVLSSFSRTNTPCQNKCFGAQCFCKPCQKPWAFLNFPCAVLVMAIQLSKRLFGLPWRKQELSFQKVQQRSQVFAWLPPEVNFWAPRRLLHTLLQKIAAGHFQLLNWTPAARVWEGIPVLPAKPWDAVYFYQGKTTGKKDRFVWCNLQGKQLS